MHNRRGSSKIIDAEIKSGEGTTTNYLKVSRNGKSAVSRARINNNKDLNKLHKENIAG